MSSTPPLSAQRERRLDDILAEYLDSLEAGQAPERAALILLHPEYADDLNEFFANHDQMALLARLKKTTAYTASLDAGEYDPAITPPSQRFGDYEIVEELARGGMGVVYR